MRPLNRRPQARPRRAARAGEKARNNGSRDTDLERGLPLNLQAAAGAQVTEKEEVAKL